MRVLLVLCLLAFVVCSQEHLTAQNLSIINNSPGSLNLRLELEQQNDDLVPVDSVVLQPKEKIIFKKQELFVAFYQVTVRKKSESSTLAFIWDEDITLIVDSTYRMMATGSKLTDEYNKFNREVVDPARTILVENTRLSNLLRQKGDSFQADSQLVKNNFLVYEVNQKIDNLVRTGKRDFLNLYRLKNSWEGLGITTTKRILAEFSQSWHTHPIYKAISEEIEKVERIGEGTIAETFTRNTITGSVITLSEIQSKYILLDFWGSWCKPCIESIPELKEMNLTYQGEKLSIIGIATENTIPSNALRKIVKSREISWPQIEESRVGTERLTDRFCISAFPTYILLDKNLTIIKRGGPEIFQDILDLLSN